MGQLSGGEMQRVAICRALLRRPPLVLADEPTGSLDDTTGLLVMDLLLDLVRDEGAALLYVTHSRELAGRADTAWRLADGRLETDPLPEPRHDPLPGPVPAPAGPRIAGPCSC